MICLKINGFGAFLRVAAEGVSTPALLVGVALGLVLGVGILIQRSRVLATQRLLAAADVYAELQIAQDPQIPVREFATSFWPGGLEESGFFSRRKYHARFESQGG